MKRGIHELVEPYFYTFLTAAEETEIEDVEAVSKEVVTMKPTEAPSPRFLPGQTWQPWAQQQQMSGQFLPGQTWQQWAQPQNNYLAGQTWQQWAQPQRSYLAGQTWQPWAQEAMASNEVMQGIKIENVNNDYTSTVERTLRLHPTRPCR